jgi:hypothetical protein
LGQYGPYCPYDLLDPLHLGQLGRFGLLGQYGRYCPYCLLILLNRFGPLGQYYRLIQFYPLHPYSWRFLQDLLNLLSRFGQLILLHQYWLPSQQVLYYQWFL